MKDNYGATLLETMSPIQCKEFIIKLTREYIGLVTTEDNINIYDSMRVEEIETDMMFLQDNLSCGVKQYCIADFRVFSMIKSQFRIISEN